MMQRRFAPRCGKCHQKTMAIATVDYRIQIDHDGKKYDVRIPALSVPKCTNPGCGALSVDDVASEQIDKEFRQTANLLAPSEIRNSRIKLGFPQQQEFAQCLGVAVSTLSRWETGAQVQQHFHDGILRAFFAIPELRAFLASLHGVKGMAVEIEPQQPSQPESHRPYRRQIVCEPEQPAGGTVQASQPEPHRPPGRRIVFEPQQPAKPASEDADSQQKSA